MSKKRKGWRKPQFIKNYRNVDPNRGDTFKYRAHAASLGTDGMVPVPQAGTILGQCNVWQDVEPRYVMPERGHQIPEKRDPAPPFIRVILKLWQTDRRQGVDGYHCIYYPHPDYPELYLYFSGNEYLWGYISHGYLRVSITYIGKGPAEFAYKNKRIRWLDRFPIAPS